MYWNSCNKPPVSDYGNLVIACLTAFEAIPVSEVSVETLKAEVAKLSPPEDETNKTEAKPVKKAAVPRKPGETPAATSTTGKVWVIADRVLASHPSITEDTDWKPIRNSVIAACESEGINKATAATQYSKFKASKIAALKS